MAKGDAERSLRIRMMERLADSRYVLLAASAGMAVLALAGENRAVVFAVCLGVLFAAALIPRRDRRRRAKERAAARPLPSAEVLIAGFAEAARDPAFVLDGNGLVRSQNRLARDIFGAAPTGEPLSSRIRAPVILDLVERTISTGKIAEAEFYELLPSERWYKVAVAPVPHLKNLPNSGPLYMLTFRDQSEARLLDRMRTDFVANASHELRTPLASLTGFIETLQGPARNDEHARSEFLGIMAEQAGRMTRLVADLMSLSRIELRANVSPSSKVDLQEVIGHVCDALRPAAEDAGIALENDLEKTSLMVRGERDELIQLFENLVENACKYAASGKRVLIEGVKVPSARPSAAPTIEITVRDFGPGIAAEHVPRLTERFYRVDVEDSRTKKGTGLGLAIVKHILARHKARLQIQSQIGEGSAFKVKFPSFSDEPSTEDEKTQERQKLMVSHN